MLARDSCTTRKWAPFQVGSFRIDLRDEISEGDGNAEEGPGGFCRNKKSALNNGRHAEDYLYP
jgi:hypothetical protein